MASLWEYRAAQSRQVRGLRRHRGRARTMPRRALFPCCLAATVLAAAALPPVLADVAATALLTLVALPPVLADTAAVTLFADPAPPPVLAKANAAAVLAVQLNAG